jgi:hypothetical protein
VRLAAGNQHFRARVAAFEHGIDAALAPELPDDARLAAREDFDDVTFAATARVVGSRGDTVAGAAERQHVLTLWENAKANYRQKPGEAAMLIASEENLLLPMHDPVELAAWTTVANVLLNLDETLMKR